ncbi:MAG: hypothetical protein AB7O24_22230 [Kofleriaceae bacterium]
MQIVRQHILIADSLIVQYDQVIRRFMDAWGHDDDTEMSLLRAELERIYTAIWENLDAAARGTQAANRPVSAYGAIRSAPGLDAGAAIRDVSEQFVGSRRIEGGLFGRDKIETTHKLTVAHNQQGLEIARKAVEALRTVWPELDWTIAPDPVVDLRPRGLLSRLFGRA